MSGVWTRDGLTPSASTQQRRPADSADAARFLKVSVSWVYEHMRPEAKDRLPVVKLGKYLRFDRRDLRAYIDAKREICQRIPRRR